MNPHIETDVFETKGQAYGIEFLLKKNTRKDQRMDQLYLFKNFFYSRMIPLAGELINNGNKYPASFDKPNMVNFIGNYRSHTVIVYR
ncbi:MAG: hypothetical protein WDM78_21025 [Puia sp.]